MRSPFQIRFVYMVSAPGFSLGFVMFLVLSLTACGNLSNEPAIIRTAAVPTVTPTPPPDRGIPLEPISILRGAALYDGAQGCQNCHGAGGKGDGPTAASLTCKVPDATNPETARPDTLTKWFAITTNGNGQTQGCLMPPWKGRLTEQQRWDVTAFLYSLHYKPAQLQSGKAVWAENCAACHGEKGLGNGPRAKDSARPVTNLADSQYMITHSDRSIYEAVTKGLGAIMPAFPQLSDDQRWAVTEYARSLSWQETISPGAANASPLTDDRALIQVQQSRILLEFPGPHVSVQQGFNFVNSSTREAVIGKDGVALRLTLPAGATSPILDADMRANFAVETGANGQPVIVSRKALQPGESRPLVVGYTIPASTPLRFSQPSDYDVQQFNLYLADSTGLTVVERDFSSGDPLTLQDETGKDVIYRQYEHRAPFVAGLPIQFTLDGQAKLITEENTNRRNTLALVIAASLTTFALIGLGVYRITRTERQKP